MKFKDLLNNSKDYDQFEYKNTKIMRVPNNTLCVFCQKENTNFLDVRFQTPLCSEECCDTMWQEYEKHLKDDFLNQHLNHYAKEIKSELICTESNLANFKKATKDILIVVHDQLDYLKITIDSVLAYTTEFHLWIWDNASEKATQDYIDQVMHRINDSGVAICTVIRSENNIGFNEPNNHMASLGDSDYLILLNSDCQVSGGWDAAMISWLQKHEDTKIVGYAGGLLDANGVGGRLAYGYEIDYVPGWCLCMSRKDYAIFGLFNPKLKFAYAEDSELSIRIQEAGYKIYALHLCFVHHFENKTINAVKNEGQVDVKSTFDYNHKMLRELWSDYLNSKRVDVRKRKSGEEALDEIIGKLE